MFAQLDPFMQKQDKKSPCAVEVDGQGEERNRGKRETEKVGRKKRGMEVRNICFVLSTHKSMKFILLKFN